jgi:serine/threonine protein phosphatase PrpC
MHGQLQDAIFWIEPGEGSSFAILTVADGHGSATSFRSNRGANYAVTSAARGLQEFLVTTSSLPNLSEVKRSATEDLPRKIVKLWVEEVRRNLDAEPFSAKELDTLEAKSGRRARETVEANPVFAYGTTVLAAAAGDRFILYLQLGDGNIVCVSKEGEPVRPMPPDERLFANETTSLCAPQAWRDFRVQFQVILDRSPALILLSTDGYANSYQTDAGFLKVGTDILEAIRSEGIEEVRERLPGWLKETSDNGSGDDITLGLIINECTANVESDHGALPGGC